MAILMDMINEADNMINELVEAWGIVIGGFGEFQGDRNVARTITNILNAYSVNVIFNGWVGLGEMHFTATASQRRDVYGLDSNELADAREKIKEYGKNLGVNATVTVDLTSIK